MYKKIARAIGIEDWSKRRKEEVRASKRNRRLEQARRNGGWSKEEEEEVGERKGERRLEPTR